VFVSHVASSEPKFIHFTGTMCPLIDDLVDFVRNESKSGGEARKFEGHFRKRVDSEVSSW
jgi:hypothetical protein